MVVIGPLAEAEHDRIITLHKLLNYLDSKSPNPSRGSDKLEPPYLADNAVLLVLKPKEIEGCLTRDNFCPFTPDKRYELSCICDAFVLL